MGLINFACQVHSHLRVYLQPLTVGATLASPQDRDVSRPIPPPLRRALQFWVDPRIWDYIPPFQITLPRLVLWTDASRAGWGAPLHPHATAHASWGPLEAALHINVLELRAVRKAISAFHLSSCHLVVYTDNETVRFALTHLRSRSLPLREELKSLLHDRATGFSPPATHSHQPQCRSGRPQPPRAPEYGVDATSRSLLRDPSLGGSSSGGPPGLSDKSPSATVGVSFSSPGCSGLQLSQYRLERLRQHLRVSSSRSDSDPPATHPRIPRSPGSGGSMGLPGPLVAPPLAAGQRSPTSADDPVPVLRTRPGLPQVGDLRTLDRLSFYGGPF